MTVTNRTVNEAFTQALDILVACAAPGAAAFAGLISAIPGAYPGDIHASLGRLTAAGLLDAAATGRLTAPALPAQSQPGSPAVLPEPHPLDCDWRFDPATAVALAGSCAASARPGGVIALLGCPSLLEAAQAAGTARGFVLLEGSAATCAALTRSTAARVIHCDLARDPLPLLAASTVVADPPWYPMPTLSFLWAAATVSAPGATVLLAQPGLATRPGILAERAQAIAFAATAGMRLATVAPGAVGYQCPPFERRALAAAGLPAVPGRWRRGDLIELRRVGPLTARRPEPEPAGQWDETWIGRARLRIRTDQPPPAVPQEADPRLVRLVPGDVLSSVSRRDPVRPAIAVWTGSNRVFGCRNPRLLAAIARAVAEGADPAHAASAAADRALLPDEGRRAFEAARQIAALAETENSEIASGPGASVVASPQLPEGPLR